MRTHLSHQQVSTIIEAYFERQASNVDFMIYEIDDDGVFRGVMVQHDMSVELPKDGHA